MSARHGSAGTGLLRRDLHHGADREYPLDSRGGLRIQDLGAGRFLTVEYASDHASVRLSIRDYAEPGRTEWCLRLAPEGGYRTDGRVADGVRLPTVLLVRTEGKALLELSPDGEVAGLHEIRWYNETNFNPLYEGLIDACYVRDTSEVFVSVQRLRFLYVHDLVTGERIDKIELPSPAGGGGSLLHLIDGSLWTINYDTLCCVDVERREVAESLVLQPRLANGGYSFADGLYPLRGSAELAATRPDAGDVVIIDRTTMQVRQSVRVGCSPIACVVTSGGRIIASDWETGRLTERQR